MAFTNSTQNLHLPQWLPDDKPTWLTDMNEAFNTIDGAFAGDRGSISNIDSRVTNQGITIASNTEAIHNNATQIVAINNDIAKLSGTLFETRIQPPDPVGNVTMGGYRIDVLTYGKAVFYRVNFTATLAERLTDSVTFILDRKNLVETSKIPVVAVTNAGVADLAHVWLYTNSSGLCVDLSRGAEPGALTLSTTLSVLIA